jgi:hypothetical protein
VVAENLARIVPYSIIMRECGTLRGVEALIIGASGLLDECGESDYAKMLRQEFMHLAAKYNITPLKASAWSVDCITPYQHPLLHLAQLSALLHSGTITMSNILSSSTPESLKSMFGAQLSDFWCNHIGGAEPLAPRMGVTRRTILGINFVAPIIYTYGRTIGQHDYLAHSLALLQALPAEDNRYTKQWSQHGITPTTIVKSVRDIIEIGSLSETGAKGKGKKKLSAPAREKLIEQLSAEMREAAKRLDFEQAAYLRDKIKELREEKDNENGK